VSLLGQGGVELQVDGQAREVTPYLRKFVWRESAIEGGFTWAASLSADAWRDWNDIILGVVRDLRWRFKVQEAGKDSSTPWRRAYVTHSATTFTSTVITFEVGGTDIRAEMKQLPRTRIWRQTAVSDVVAAMAKEHGLDSVVERTIGVRDRYQIRESDWDYLARLSATETTLDGGRGDAYVWLDGTTLRLGAAQAQARSDRRHNIDLVENRVDRTVVSYNGRHVDWRGGASLRGVGFDFETKSAVIFDLGAAQASSHPALAQRVPRDPAAGLRIFPTPDTSAEAVEGVVRSAWGKLASRYFTLRLDTRPDVALRPMMLVDVQGPATARHQTPLLGRFIVLEVEHVYDRGRATTTAVAFRREAYDGEADPTGASVAAAGTRDRYRFGGKNETRVVQVAEVVPE
jgi:hypothetical protein